MRFVTWNGGRGGIKMNASRIAELKADVLVAPEVEELDRELFMDRNYLPRFRDRTAKPGCPLGTGVFSYTDASIQRVPGSDHLPGYPLYTATKGDLAFQVAPIWAHDAHLQNPAHVQACVALHLYGDWLRERPTVVLGDFNVNLRHDDGRAWQFLMELIEPLGLVSAYHHFFGESPGEETRRTCLGHDYSLSHVDYCFVPREWADRIKNVELGRRGDWSSLSDHVPLIVDIAD